MSQGSASSLVCGVHEVWRQGLQRYEGGGVAVWNVYLNAFETYGDGIATACRVGVYIVDTKLQKQGKNMANPRRTSLSTGSLAMASTMGGRCITLPRPSRHSADARSKRKPSTWYSVTHQRSESRMSDFMGSVLALVVLPQPL